MRNRIAHIHLVAGYSLACADGRRTRFGRGPNRGSHLGHAVVGYYGDWDRYGGHNAPISDVQFSKLNALILAFATPQNGACNLVDTGDPTAVFPTIKAMKAKYPKLRVLLSVGGWSYRTYFSDTLVNGGEDQDLRSAIAPRSSVRPIPACSTASTSTGSIPPAPPTERTLRG